MKVVIVVLTINNYSDTRECLESLRESDYEDYGIVLVDNGSTDDSVDLLIRDFPEIVLLRSDKNLGYAGGNNLGIEYAVEQGADFVWILNNDIIVHPESLRILLEAASTNPDAGILGPLILSPVSNQVHFAGGKISRLSGRSSHVGIGREDRDSFDSRTETDFLTGASILVNARMIEKVGMLDEKYFLYWEDADWALRARKAGWKVLFVPEATVWHKVSTTSGSENPIITYYRCRNSLLCSSKNYPAYLPLVMIGGLRHYVFNNLVLYFIHGLDSNHLMHLKMALRGYRDYLRRRLGPFGGWSGL